MKYELLDNLTFDGKNFEVKKDEKTFLNSPDDIEDEFVKINKLIQRNLLKEVVEPPKEKNSK